MNISQFGKGALVTPVEKQDSLFKLGVSPPNIDWSQPYTVENGFTLKQRNQSSSSSCTAQATSYYCEALEMVDHHKTENYSARFIYSQTNLGYGQGTYIWKAMSVPPKIGLANAISVPDGDSTEKTMIDTSLNAQALLEAKTDVYAVLQRSTIDQMAQIIKDYYGFVTGFNGWNGMFDQYGTVVDWSRSDWGHCVYVCGFETRMVNGVVKKYLKFKNSWTENWGSNGYGYFSEDFVNSGMMFDAYVYAAIEDLDPNSPHPATIMTKDEVIKQYVLAFYREPDATELAFWIGKDLLTFLNTAIKDRSVFLQSHE